MGKVLTDSDWYSALGNTEYADYLMAARDRFLQHEAATTRQVKAVYTRVAKQLRYEIQQVAPGTLRAGHLTALAKKLEQAADTLNREMLNAVYAGIKLAVQDATDGTEQITLDVLKDLFDQSSVRAMFASINEQAVLAVLSRTRHDGLKVSDRIWRVSQNTRAALTRVVEDGVARGLNSRVLARRVQQYMQPDVWTDLKEETRQQLKVPRNISMEAMRLAVTELHHAFHEGAIQSYRVTPSYQGVYWRLSASHPHTDICDTYASHGGNGFWEAGNEPTKPHPWCRCVIVPRLEDTDKFVQRLRQWASDPQSQPDIENWYNGLPRQFLRRPGRTTQVTIPGLFQSQQPSVPRYVQEVQGRLNRAHTLDNVLEIGHILRRELEQRTGDLERELQQVLQRKTQIAEQLDRMRRQGKTADRQRLLDEYDKLEQRRREVMAKLQNRADMVRDVLHAVREFNTDTNIKFEPRSDKEAVRRIKGQLTYLPKDWVDAFRNRQLAAHMDYGSRARSFYTRERSGREHIVLRATAGDSVTLHELVHRCEAWVPKLVQLEQAFYQHRTAGESLQWLGPPYDRNEVTRFDRFTHPYMGKDYGGYFFELMTMGVEMVFYGLYEPERDPEYVAFVLGVLVTA